MKRARSGWEAQERFGREALDGATVSVGEWYGLTLSPGQKATLDAENRLHITEIADALGLVGAVKDGDITYYYTEEQLLEVCPVCNRVDFNCGRHEL
jgi:hypothetical protein